MRFLIGLRMGGEMSYEQVEFESEGATLWGRLYWPLRPPRVLAEGGEGVPEAGPAGERERALVSQPA